MDEIIHTCILCPLSKCHGYDEIQITMAAKKEPTVIKCPVILGKALGQLKTVENWARENSKEIMAIKWMERYCDQMISRIEWSKENEQKQLGLYHSDNHNSNGNGSISNGAMLK